MKRQAERSDRDVKPLDGRDRLIPVLYAQLKAARGNERSLRHSDHGRRS
jgi:hypothetical protein